MTNSIQRGVLPVFVILFLVSSFGQDTTPAPRYADTEPTVYEPTLPSSFSNHSRLIPLHISLFVSLGDVDSSGVFVANDLAIRHVNARKDLLPGYELKATLVNSSCNDGIAIKALFDEIFRGPQKLMIIGPSCSVSAQAIASTAKFWNINMISPSASSPALENRNKFPTFTRLIPSDTALNPSRIARNYSTGPELQQYIKTTTSSHCIDDLLNRLKENNVTIISAESFDEDCRNQVENLKKQDARIIAANMYYPAARKMFCEVYKHNMYGEGYVWLLLGEYNKGWYREPDDTLSCTMEELREVVESSMYIGHEAPVLRNDDTVTAGGITSKEYRQLFDEHIKLFDGFTPWPQSSFGYDAIFAAALAMNETINILKERRVDGRIKKLEDFTFEDQEVSEILLDAINNVNIEGVSGPIRLFNGERIGLIVMKQMRGKCDDDWSLSGRWCYLFHGEIKPFVNATAHCTDHDSSLIEIRSEKEHNALRDLSEEPRIAGISSWLTSLKRSSTGLYVWPDGTAFNSEDALWKSEKEHLLLNENDACVTVDFSINKWTVVSCASGHAFICKKLAEFRQVIIATHDIAEDKIDWISDIIWPGDKIPLDHTPEVIYTVVEVYQDIPFVSYVIMCTVSVVGVIMSVGFLMFNIYYRHQRYLKMSSPSLNNLIIIGSILIYASACLTGWDDSDISNQVLLLLCKTRVWFFSVGFVLSFGSMFSKTWRVHKVAALKNPKRVIITDRHLFLLVAVLLLIDVALLTAWFIINPMRFQRKDLHRLENIEQQVVLQPYVKFCVSDNGLYWKGAIYCYKALLLIFGTFLAWETRKVTIPALNDSKLIGLCVYNVVLLSAIGVGVNLAMSMETSGSFLFTSAIQIFCTTVTLVVIFVPKILSVHKYPEGKRVTTMKTNSANLSSVDGNVQNEDDMNQMKEKIAELERQLSKKQEVPSGCGFWCGTTTCALCRNDGSDKENMAENDI